MSYWAQRVLEKINLTSCCEYCRGLVQGFLVVFSGTVPRIMYHMHNVIVKVVLCSAQPQGKSTGLLAVESQHSDFLSERFLFKPNTGWEKEKKNLSEMLSRFFFKVAAILMEKKCALASIRGWIGCSVIRKMQLPLQSYQSQSLPFEELLKCLLVLTHPPGGLSDSFFFPLQEGQ